MNRMLLALALLIILSLLVLPSVSGTLTKLVTHVFAKGIDKSGTRWKPINVTDTFTQDDDYVYAFTTASFSETNFTWRWYDPSGAVFNTDSATFECGQGTCDFYDRLSIRGTDAALKTGIWKMDLLAAGVKVYTDLFKLEPVIEEEIEWHFDIVNATYAHVNMTDTIRPYPGGGQGWGYYSAGIWQDVINFHAFECGTYNLLGVTHSQQGDHTNVKVMFDTHEGDRYCFILSFDLGASAMGTIGNDLFLTWLWSSDSAHAQPQRVTVTLPNGYTFVNLKGAANYTRSTNAGRDTVSFSGIAPPLALGRGGFQWTIVYAPIPQVTSTTQATTQETTVAAAAPVQLPFPILLALGVVVVAGGLAVLFMKRRKVTK